ncbi:DsbA family oxidoreductase [Rhodobacter capsulatus]|jgi:predicted DsbA family dithiol-disulfide isomerase|uniref:Oxidoreductase, DSBA family n=1 Tax=Rhodobacter capsulatus (strain ATCC BAA-309 / NBRC 16581 / SB1003) TaxID=272942 RepID=D5AUB8_RHOCB|nr:DsbA family oxidoreductase [Rhodobacter capsulatus]ADE85557.1 oxidoreductase, DSBA family [Rhodobacter capsulatus SB 1003]ETD01590.1 polyketide biosynthesis protein [Rhodobacter capsulatus DE442]ETD76657.1 polyketide biosynthesis protein [Rhodobacter capsulatus R121]ETD81241.1 polyketide biosynthesis protein [Rhodobacter capsulatus B6]ETD84486.1 polyketide biosynthesis protein [Rhodobacter capsulatus YW1]
MITLDIFADPTCPWCYLAKAQLDRALEARPGHPFLISWQPFQLNPTLPAEGMDRGAWLRARFGVQADRVDLPVLEAARTAGVALNLPIITRMPNTLNAHRLLHWAGIEGAQTAVMSGLLRAYWRDGQDIGQPDILVTIAADAGLDAVLIRRLLATDADAETIRSRAAHARERGVTSVPTFILDNTHVITGAQPAKLWMQVIDEIAAT